MKNLSNDKFVLVFVSSVIDSQKMHKLIYPKNLKIFNFDQENDLLKFFSACIANLKNWQREKNKISIRSTYTQYVLYFKLQQTKKY